MLSPDLIKWIKSVNNNEPVLITIDIFLKI